MSGWAGVPGTGCDACGFSEHLVMTIGYLARLGNRLGKILLLRGMLPCGAV
jgi:hypothetical protein